MKKPSLVPESKQWYKLWSVQAALVAVIIGLQEALPLWKGIVPDNIFAIMAATVGMIGAVLRQVKQKPSAPPSSLSKSKR